MLDKLQICSPPLEQHCMGLGIYGEGCVEILQGMLQVSLSQISTPSLGQNQRAFVICKTDIG